jgi:chloramphenicol 3-O phosphotransferase
VKEDIVTAGTIVILNGTSSSGKSSIARALQEVMDEPFLHTGIDEYSPHVPVKFTTITGGDSPTISDYFTIVYDKPPKRIEEQTPFGEVVYGDGIVVDAPAGPKGVRLIRALYAGVAAIAASGVSLVVDEVFHQPSVLRAVVEELSNSHVLFVGLRLPLEVAEQRERDRGDRGPGGARLFYDRVHAHGIYDLELDTSVHRADACAQAIKDVLLNGRRGQAFQTLARRFAERSDL